MRSQTSSVPGNGGGSDLTEARNHFVRRHRQISRRCTTDVAEDDPSIIADIIVDGVGVVFVDFVAVDAVVA